MIKIRIVDVIPDKPHTYAHCAALLYLIFKVDPDAVKNLLRRNLDWAESYPRDGCYVPVTEISRVFNVHKLTDEACYWLNQPKGLLFVPKSCYEIVRK